MVHPFDLSVKPALIDAGNTAIKLYQSSATHSNEEAPSIEVLERTYRPVTVEDWYTTLLEHDITTAHWVSSWPAEEQQRWQQELQQRGIALNVLERQHFLPCLPHWHYNTDELGLDRIIGIAAVYPYTTPETGVVLISAGTATCVEFITHDGYQGGWIQPGLRAWCDSMKHPAPHLPTFEASTLPLQPVVALGNNTHTAVLKGLITPYLYSITGSIVQTLNRVP